jgi:hypothetical protein
MEDTFFFIAQKSPITCTSRYDSCVMLNASRHDTTLTTADLFLICWDDRELWMLIGASLKFNFLESLVNWREKSLIEMLNDLMSIELNRV